MSLNVTKITFNILDKSKIQSIAKKKQILRRMHIHINIDSNSPPTTQSYCQNFPFRVYVYILTV